MIFAVLALAVGAADLEVSLSGLRNHRGLIRVCVTQDRAHFPDCGRDPQALRKTVPATSDTLVFANVRPGDYAVTLFHDENANNKLDTFLGIPREGFAFSRNPTIRFGAPQYDKVNIELGPGITRLRLKLQYLL